jgi:hypothetical protein
MDVVITTIFPPTKGAHALSEGLSRVGGTLWVLGDRKGPVAYDLPNTKFYDIESQIRSDFQLARHLPEKVYTRKNLGYLLAIQAGAPFIVETDDDNIPREAFWGKREARVLAAQIEVRGWHNIYRCFSSERIWPRGFPLENLQGSFASAPVLSPAREVESLIQQALADENPDVDAVYRLTGNLPVDFQTRTPIALGKFAWCPFNSQNTTTFPAAYPLLYLPSYCSFRMTDIWRSFVAQRCLWEMDSVLGFSNSTVYQERNEHNLLRDFEDEVPGYLQNERIRQILESLNLKAGRGLESVSANLLTCYEALVAEGIIKREEIRLVEAWNSDLASLVK